jgi:hypothetical protein
MYGANSSVSATDRGGFMLFLCVVFKKERKIVKINYTPKPYKDLRTIGVTGCTAAMSAITGK